MPAGEGQDDPTIRLLEELRRLSARAPPTTTQAEADQAAPPAQGLGGLLPALPQLPQLPSLPQLPQLPDLPQAPDVAGLSGAAEAAGGAVQSALSSAGDAAAGILSQAPEVLSDSRAQAALGIAAVGAVGLGLVFLTPEDTTPAPQAAQDTSASGDGKKGSTQGTKTNTAAASSTPQAASTAAASANNAAAAQTAATAAATAASTAAPAAASTAEQAAAAAAGSDALHTISRSASPTSKRGITRLQLLDNGPDVSEVLPARGAAANEPVSSSTVAQAADVMSQPASSSGGILWQRSPAPPQAPPQGAAMPAAARWPNPPGVQYSGALAGQPQQPAQQPYYDAPTAAYSWQQPQQQPAQVPFPSPPPVSSVPWQPQTADPPPRTASPTATAAQAAVPPDPWTSPRGGSLFSGAVTSTATASNGAAQSGSSGGNGTGIQSSEGPAAVKGSSASVLPSPWDEPAPQRE